MKTPLLCLLFTALFCLGYGQTGIPVPQMSHCDNLMTQFLNTYDIPSATMALAKDGKMVYMRAFGDADLAQSEATQPYHMFRIASVSKPITAIAIMKMVENGQLNLADKVFGTNGILANHSYLSSANVTDNRIYDITVQHLLEHSGGWNRDVACTPNPPSPYTWSVTHCDPIGFPLHVTQTLGEPNPVSEPMLIRFLMEKGVEFDPGTDYAYSNIGYLALGLVIEEISGLSYEDYVKTEILAPLGIYDMYIGKNLLADRREREGEYQGNGYNAPSIYGTGLMVPWEYGGWNLEAMDAHGGWIATARDLVRLLVAIDGFASKPDILNTTSINTMTTPSANNSFYAKGWSVNAFDNWWHTGALDGTASIWVRSSGGYTWAIILNKRVIGGNSSAFWSAFDNLPWNCVSQTTTYPSHDLLDFPTEAASDLVFNGAGGTDLTVSWTRGNGNQSLLVVRETGTGPAFPLDGADYSADANYSSGDDLGSGNFVLYSGTGNSVTVTGLDASKTYEFRVYEFKKNTTTGFHALYLLGNAPAEEATTATNTTIEDLGEQGISFYPNPIGEVLEIELAEPGQADYLEIRNLQGQLLRWVNLTQSQTILSLSDLSPQIYVISFFREEYPLGHARLVKM